MSFPSFKFSLFNQAECEKLQHKNLFEKLVYTSGIEVSLSNDVSVENVLSQYRIILKSFETFVNEQKVTGSQFTVIDLGNYIMRTLKISDKFETRAFAQTIINAAFEFGKIKAIKFISERAMSNTDNQRYVVHQDGDIFSGFIMTSVTSVLNPSDNYALGVDMITSFQFKSHSDIIDAKIAALGIGDARKLLNYQVIGGSNPQIYLRMNSVYPLEKAIKQGDNYKNSILQDIQTKYYTSVEMLKFLFTKEQSNVSTKERILNYTKWFWDTIENYFMGIIPNEVKEVLSKSRL
jgi:ATP-dependent DNA helicase RecQ